MIRILLIILAISLALNTGQFFYQRLQVKYLHHKITQLEADRVLLEAEVKKQKVEVEYAKKTASIRTISKKYTPRRKRIVQLYKKARKAVKPQKVKSQDWSAACHIANAINGLWGVKALSD